MSSKKTKTKVSQNDLRKMMQQMKSKRVVGETTNGSTTNQSGAHKRAHPPEILSQKNDIKKAKLAAKLQRDMERIIAAKSGKSVVSGEATSNERKHKLTQKETQEVSAPKAKLVKILPPKKAAQPKTGLLLGTYSDSASSDDEQQQPMPMSMPVSSNGKGESSAKPKETGDKTKKDDSSVLPEGFFDDPEKDAVMRGVETPAHKMDREWESFQKQLQHEEGHSEQIIEEEKETGHLDREIEEIDEQIKLYNLVDKLADKKDSVIQVVKSVKPKFKKQDEESSSGSEDEDDLLDWREKDAFT